MATLGEQYDSILVDISNTQKIDEYQTASGERAKRANLSVLYKERDRLLDKIERFGRNYTEGQNTTPIGDTSLVSFA